MSVSEAESWQMTEQTYFLMVAPVGRAHKDRYERSTDGGMVLENQLVSVPDLSAAFAFCVRTVYECLRT
jgi:hypothetical protein